MCGQCCTCTPTVFDEDTWDDLGNRPPSVLFWGTLGMVLTAALATVFFVFSLWGWQSGYYAEQHGTDGLLVAVGYATPGIYFAMCAISCASAVCRDLLDNRYEREQH